jgi:arylsulfatase A-like enzyme
VPSVTGVPAPPREVVAPRDVVAAHEVIAPRNVVVVLLDSLNRHLLGGYGSDEFDTPNLDRFARVAVRFEQHYAGSLPCMPARHDLLVGALDFLWRPWGSIELWEEPVTAALRRAGVTTKLVTDHPHLFEVGGENYHCDFTAWDYQRGHESDLWRTRPDPSWVGAPSFGRQGMPYDRSRGWFRGEDDFPGPRVMREAARWIEEEAAAHERYLLFVDEFDPHEPFDTPEPYASMYDDAWTGPHLVWPPYTIGAVRNGVITEREARQLRAQYGGKLTMIDRWFGHLLAAIDRSAAAGETAVIVCTDHGHYLGEKDTWGKPQSPVFEPLGHIPLLVRWPGAGAGARQALTTAVDVHATLLDVFGADAAHRTHGRSLVPLLDARATSVREWCLAGVWGREVHLLAQPGATAGVVKYARAPEGRNEPLVMLSNRWSTMPIASAPDLRLPRPDGRATLGRMPGSDVPVLRQPFTDGDLLPFWGYGPFVYGTVCYDLGDDPAERHNRAGEPLGKEHAALLRDALDEVDAPPEQLARLGYS